MITPSSHSFSYFGCHVRHPLTNKELVSSPIASVSHSSSVESPPLGLTTIGTYLSTSFIAASSLPTSVGTFQLRAYRSAGTTGTSEPTALVYGNISGQSHVHVRVHDQCLTSEVFGSLKCDCKEQLEAAKAHVVAHGSGMIIYLPQEGRGIGMANKVAAYALQESVGVDTVDGNRLLGLADDYRTYDCVTAILADCNVRSIELMTNNPRKLRLLREGGITITGRLPIVIPPGRFNHEYITTKVTRMNHMYDTDMSTSQDEAIGNDG